MPETLRYELKIKLSSNNIIQFILAFGGCIARRGSRQGPACAKPVERGCAQGLFCSECFSKHSERSKKCSNTHTTQISSLVAARQAKSKHVVESRSAVKREMDLSGPSSGKEDPKRKRARRSGPARQPDVDEHPHLAVVSQPPKRNTLCISVAPPRAGSLPLGCQPKADEFKACVMRDLVGSVGLQIEDFRLLKL